MTVPPPDPAPVPLGDSLVSRLGGGDPSPRYAVQDRLGSGATASVWALHDLSLDRPLAAKVLEQADGEALSGFIAEARTTAGLEHPNVLPVHDVDLCRDGRPFFTMKRIGGSSLGAAIAASTPDARHAAIRDANAVVSIALAVANALSYAHSRRIIHQDVKPDNVMLGDFGEVLLVDWGSAQDLGKGAPRLYGTPLYMAPEQARHDSADERSDVYCLGATLFHALTLRLPTMAGDADEFWRRKRAGEIDAPTAQERRRLPAALLAIALKAMAADPERRYPSMDALAADLRAFQAGQAVTAKPEAWWRRLARWFRRHARAFAVIAPTTSTAVLLVLVVFGDQLKAMATWGSPVLRERFADPTLPGWTACGMHGAKIPFAVRGGALVTLAATDSLFVARQRFEGDVRIEYDCWYEPDMSAPGDLSLLWCPETGFGFGSSWAVLDRSLQFEFGAHSADYSAIQAGNHIVYDTARPVRGRRYHVRVEIRGEIATFAIDGVERCRYVAPLPIGGGWPVLYSYGAGKAFANVTVWVRDVPRLVPATAVGDWLLRDKAYDRAAVEYARVADSHPGTELSRTALFREGLARWSSGDRAGGEESWKLLDGTAWADEAALVRVEAAIADGADDAVLADLERLAAATPALTPRLADLWCAAVDAVSHRYATAANRAAAERYLALRARRFAGHAGARMLAAGALLFLERYQEVLDRFADDAWHAGRALMLLGRAQEVIARYPDAQLRCYDALWSMGRQEEALRLIGVDPDDPRANANLLLDRGRAEEVPEDSSAASFDAALMLGRFGDGGSDFAGETAYDTLWLRTMIYRGRAHEIPERIAAVSVPVLLAQGRIDEACAAAEATPSKRWWARHARGMRAEIVGDHAAAERDFAPEPNREFGQEMVEPARTLIVPFLRELAGDREALAHERADIAARRRWDDGQVPWFAIRWLLGEIGDEAFAAQPYRSYFPAELALGRGVRAERAGRAAEALVAYREYLALPPWRRSTWLDPFADGFVAWRVERIATSTAGASPGPASGSPWTAGGGE